MKPIDIFLTRGPKTGLQWLHSGAMSGAVQVLRTQRRYCGLNQGGKLMKACHRGRFLGAAAVIASASLVGFSPPASGEGNNVCARYAKRALVQYRVMTEQRKCRVKPDARWQPNYQNHYDWCVSARAGWPRSEEKARDDHLSKCGGQSTY